MSVESIVSWKCSAGRNERTGYEWGARTTTDRSAAVGAEVNRDPEQYSQGSEERDLQLIPWVIDVVLLRRHVEYPADPEVPDPPVMQAWATAGRAILGEHPGDA